MVKGHKQITEKEIQVAIFNITSTLSPNERWNLNFINLAEMKFDNSVIMEKNEIIYHCWEWKWIQLLKRAIGQFLSKFKMPVSSKFLKNLNTHNRILYYIKNGEALHGIGTNFKVALSKEKLVQNSVHRMLLFL